MALAEKDTQASGILSPEESEIRYRRLFESAQDGILILDAETGMIEDVNPYLINMLGYSRQEFIQKKLWEVGAFKDVKANKQAFQALQKNEYIRYEDLPLRAKDGRLMQVEFVSNVYLAGRERVIQCNIRDVTERNQAKDALLRSEALLREQSVRDHLTGLFNRRYLEETFDRELLRATRNAASVGIILLDVDNFKQYNDVSGHAAGDAILRELGSLLLANVRGEDIPCRYGGDEFTIVMPDAPLEITRQRAELLLRRAGRFQIPFEGRILKPVALSVGVAAFPENGLRSGDLLRAADMALYQAKREGRGRVIVASQDSPD
ncbi:MAG: sensor domain-containing diguanylate cyclase [Anaerolineales bacterium]